MCGISGTIDLDSARGQARVTRINALQRHRGPDHTALATIGHCTIGNTRLAIQDVSPAGNQPLTSADGRYVAVFNGEIYNFRELRARFSVPVHSETDGAVVPALWSMLGPECLSLLEGMWALAVVDREMDSVTVARDPFGIKPLYLRVFPDGTVVFASELRPLAILDPPAEIDSASFADYLRFGAMGPETSPYLGIRPLSPNHWMQLTAPKVQGGAVVGVAGQVLTGERPLTRPTWTPGPWEALIDSVDHHLIADVPTALLLSAGVDSSLLACAAQRRGHTLDCFTVTLPGQDDECDEAATTARHYGHRHHVVAADLNEDDVEAYFASMQRPSIDGLNTFLISKSIHTAGYRVALSGLGGDEAIAGYPHMRYFPLLRLAGLTDILGLGNLLGRLPLRPKLAALIRSSGPRDAKGFDALFRQVFDDEALRRLLGPGLIVNAQPGMNCQRPSGDMSLRSLIDEEVVNYLQRTLLPDADAFSMCWSVELRVPFLDVHYFRVAATFARPLQGKSQLAALPGDDRLNILRRRKKQGFTLPMSDWMRTGPLAAPRSELRERSAPIWDFLDRRASQVEIDSTHPKRWAVPWALVVLDQWLRSQRRERVSSGICP